LLSGNVMFTVIDVPAPIKNKKYHTELKSQYHLDDYHGDFANLINLYVNAIFSEEVEWCHNILQSNFGVCSHILHRSRLYYWQKYFDSNPKVMLSTYNRICKLIDYAGTYLLGLEFPFANQLKLKPLTKYESNSGSPAWTRYCVYKLDPDEHWYDVFLDGVIGFALYYKGKYQGIIGINFDRTGNPVIVQLQSSKKCRLNYKLNVQKFLLKFVVSAFSQSNTPLYLQSAQNNIYRKPEYNSNGHVAPMSKLMKAYNLNAFHSGFIYDTITKNHLLFKKALD
jgi:hypothetical protein